jgi:adenine-specific DNA-methyltransferase
MRFESGGYSPDNDFRWKAGKRTIDSLFARNRIIINEDGIPVEKKYEVEEQDPLYPIYCFIDPSLSGTAESGKAELNELFGNKHGMDSVKPVDLIKYLIFTFSDDNDKILDFFAGSSTTAQALIELNIEENVARKYILCQLPQEIDKDSEAYKAGFKKITDIGKKRILAASNKINSLLEEKFSEKNYQIGADDSSTVKNHIYIDMGFRVLKLDKSNLKKWQLENEKIEVSLLDNIDHYIDGRSNLDIVFEVMLKNGYELTLPIEKYDFDGKSLYCVDRGRLMICLDNEILLDLINKLIQLKNDLGQENVCVVLKDSGFKDDSVKVNVLEMLRINGIEEIISI